jgi:hypothetical protein
MSRIFLTGGLVLAAGLAGAADDPSVKGAAVTISGCVIDGSDGSYVLTHVQEISGPRSSVAPKEAVLGAKGIEGGTPEVIYWLSRDSAKLLRDHVNHKVEVAGVITELTTGTVRIKQRPGREGRDNKVEVSAKGREASAKTENPVQEGAKANVRSDETTVLPTRRVKVDTVKMLSATCP